MCALISSQSNVGFLAGITAKNYDIIAFDLDGTLTPSKSPLEPNMAEVLARVLSRWKVAVISGASFRQFETQFLKHLNCPAAVLANLFILPANGSSLCQLDEAGRWNCHEDQPFTALEKQKIESALQRAFITTGFVKPTKTYGPLIEDRTTQITFSALGQEAPLVLKELWDHDHLKREKIVTVLKPLLPGFAIHIGGATSIDITRVGIDKAYGLKKILSMLHIPATRMLYVGDELFPDGNDAPAQTIGATCFAVKGPEETKSLLQYLLSA